MKLYDYYRSSASYRVRIALAYKEVVFESLPIQLAEGEQHSEAYQRLNPQGLVPTLDENGHLIHQSLAIIEYLNELIPSPSLLPDNPLQRAHIRGLALMVACDIHPLNNLRALQQLKQQFNATEAQVEEWYHHWLRLGFDAYERQIKQYPREQVSFGKTITLADICLIPQVYNAKRFHFPLSPYPLIESIYDYCMALPAFSKTAP